MSSKCSFEKTVQILPIYTRWKGRLCHKIGTNAWGRFVKEFSAYLTSIVHEKELEKQKSLDSLKEYETHRRSNVFMSGCFCLAEYALGFDLPDAVFEDEVFSAIHWTAVEMIGYSNVCPFPPLLMSYTNLRVAGANCNAGRLFIQERARDWPRRK